MFLDPVDNDEAESILMSADILVNIGNSVSNQIPSKLFDYISTGKPILNIYKNKNCPSLEILSKYPDVLNVYEENALEESGAVEQFLKSKHFVNNEFLLHYNEYSELFVSGVVKQTIESVKHVSNHINMER